MKRYIAGVIAVGIFTYSYMNAQESMDHIEDKVDELFKSVQSTDPGYIAGVIMDGKLVYAKGFGLSNLDYNIPMTPQSAFYMGSTSKQFAAACLLILVEKGVLKLDDDIRKYLPEMPDYGSPIKVFHLLHHTSGVREYTSLLLQAGVDRQWEEKFSNETVYDLICRQEALNFPPGERYAYSSSGYILMSKIIERLSGKSLRQFADSVLFKPLGMFNTFFTDNHQEVIPNRVYSYRKDGKTYNQINKIFDTYADGGLISTLADLAKWDRAFYDDELGVSEFGEKMSRIGKLNDGHPINYAWGLQVHTYRGLPMIEHGGFMINFDSEMMRFPDQRLTVIVLSNCWQGGQSGAMNLSYQIANLYLASHFKDVPAKPRARKKFAAKINAEDFVGHYWNVNGNYYNTIGYSDGRLFYDDTNGWSPALIPMSDRVFAVEGTDLTIRFEGNKMTLIDPHSNNPLKYFERFDPTPPTDINELRKFEGIYTSAELETEYKLLIKGDVLFLQVNNNPVRQLFPPKEDVIWNSKHMVWIGFAEIIFHVDATGQVNGFAVGDNRVKGVKFMKISK